MSENSRHESLRLALMHYEGETVNDKYVLETADRFFHYINKPSEYEKVQSAEALVAKIPKESFSGPAEFFQYLHIGPNRTTGLGAYPIQKSLLRAYENNQITIVNQARQIGVTTTNNLYALWKAITSNIDVLIVQNNLRSVKEILEALTSMHKNIYEKIDIPSIHNQIGHRITLSNGSRIKVSTPHTSHPGQSFDLAIIDNAAYISHSQCDKLWDEIHTRVLATGGKGIVTSSPGENKGFFYDLWTAPMSKEVAKIALPWNVHPDRDADWAIEARSRMGNDTFEQQFENVFRECRKDEIS